MIMSKKRTKCYRFAAIVLVVLFSLPVALVAWGGPNEAPGQIDSPGQTYNPGINDNPALTFDPRKFKPGDRALHPDFYRKHQKPIPDFVPDALAPYYDARDDQIVTSVKSQSSCGSCWAFASAGAMESHLLKLFPAFDPLTLDLSEQQQVSCNINQSGCCGGSSTAIMFWETKGPLLESCFPYEESGTSCPIQRTVLCDSQSCEELDYRVVNWHTVTPTPAGFKTSLVTDGPSYFRYDFYDDFYDFWIYGASGEVYVNTGNNRLGGHAILLIGWDDSKGAYLCKNSWGEETGPNGDGTFWMAYSGHASDLAFQMANFNLESVGSCGNGECDAGETPCNCPDDCGPPPAEVCDDGIDNDCDNKTDCDDEDCNDDPGCLCGDGVCEPGLEDCNTCPEDCISVVVSQAFAATVCANPIPKIVYPARVIAPVNRAESRPSVFAAAVKRGAMIRAAPAMVLPAVNLSSLTAAAMESVKGRKPHVIARIVNLPTLSRLTVVTALTTIATATSTVRMETARAI